ncbi:SLC13 family permease [Ralstonia mannitolilytica]|uniref:SLC13 family permease n=1 Tax=Ralstonia mannitolilytica TaxID=105219 RepID=UPI0005D90370|nr:SLC13 family permease [Ralstonia mannitolilytica]AJW46474.1 membrane protein [Ralstonia mannitolilytica]CAJ0780104.1 Inner membrane protein YbiR [Ralstonia mannitolilytica]
MHGDSFRTPTASHHPPFWHTLKQDVFFWWLLAICGVLTLAAPRRIVEYPALVDWHTIAALGGLLILTKAVEASGMLQLLGRRLVDVASSERVLALSLVGASAVLSTVLTNDVALFVIVPLTVGLRQVATLPVTRLVIFEALAVNAGSALTPIGNPQNLFLWHQSGLSFGAFVWQMAPMVALLTVLLLAATWLAFAPHTIRLHAGAGDVDVHRRLLLPALVLYVPFLVLTDLGYPVVALAGLVVLYLLGARYVLARVDWGLLLVFVLMFIDLRLVAQLGVVRQGLDALALGNPMHLYWAGIGVSQLISNVPAAILLAEYSHDWPIIAFAVSVGGFGTLIGSLANVIALRMLGERRAWWLFHAYSMPFLAVAAGAVYAWLTWVR